MLHEQLQYLVFCRCEPDFLSLDDHDPLLLIQHKPAVDDLICLRLRSTAAPCAVPAQVGFDPRDQLRRIIRLFHIIIRAQNKSGYFVTLFRLC